MILVAACKAAPVPAPTPTNAVHRAVPVEPCTVTGLLRDAATREPLVGATVVLDGSNKQEEVAISDERGWFAIRSIGTQTTLTVYYNDSAWKSPLAGGGCGRSGEVAVEVKPPGPIVVW